MTRLRTCLLVLSLISSWRVTTLPLNTGRGTLEGGGFCGPPATRGVKETPWGRGYP